jgi:hypothetical protein
MDMEAAERRLKSIKAIVEEKVKQRKAAAR